MSSNVSFSKMGTVYDSQVSNFCCFITKCGYIFFFNTYAYKRQYMV